MRSDVVLVELGPWTQSKPKFGNALRSTLCESAKFGCVDNVDLYDTDVLSTVEEITAAVNKAIEVSVEARVFVSRANSRWQKMTTVTLTSELAGERSFENSLRQCQI